MGYPDIRNLLLEKNSPIAFNISQKNRDQNIHMLWGAVANFWQATIQVGKPGGAEDRHFRIPYKIEGWTVEIPKNLGDGDFFQGRSVNRKIGGFDFMV